MQYVICVIILWTCWTLCHICTQFNTLKPFSTRRRAPRFGDRNGGQVADSRETFPLIFHPVSRPDPFSITEASPWQHSSGSCQTNATEDTSFWRHECWQLSARPYRKWRITAARGPCHGNTTTVKGKIGKLGMCRITWRTMGQFYQPWEHLYLCALLLSYFAASELCER